MRSYILKENVLSDDLLHLPDEGRIFKGNYIAVIEFHEFLNSWSDKKNIKRFRTEKSLNNFINKNYPKFELL